MAEALDAAVRAAARKRRIPDGARCATCGFADPRALEAWGKTWRCYDCASVARGRAPMEAHHLFGKDVHPMTVPFDGNVHRILTDLEREVESEIHQLAPHDPLAWIIRLLWSVYNFARAVLDQLGRAIAWLTRLLHALRERFGNAWPKELGLPALH